MPLDSFYDQLIDAMYEQLPDGWTIARLTVQFLTDGQDVEFMGTYLDAAGEPQVMTTDFPDEIGEVAQRLYQVRQTDGQPRANTMQLDLAPTGQYTTAYSWDQEIQDEDDHFSQGGTAREWQAIREAKYGPIDGLQS